MINWSGVRYNTILGKILRIPLRLLPKRVWMPVLQGQLKGTRWISGSSNAGCWLGSYELENQHALMKMIQPGMTIFDIGAHVGFYTLFFSKLTGSQGTVVAFEPFASNIVYLLQHLQRNRCNNVQVYQLALGGGTNVVSFSPGDSSSTGTILEGRTHSDDTYYVPVLTLDELIGTYHLQIPQVIKMDVEGSESDVLEGASTLIKQHRPVWFISLHGQVQKTRCQKILESYDYEIFALNGQKKLSGQPVTEDEIYAILRQEQ